MYDDNPAAVRMQDQVSGAAIDTFGGFPFFRAVKRSGRPMTQILMEAAASIRLLLSAQSTRIGYIIALSNRLVNMMKLPKAPEKIRLFLRIKYICASNKHNFDLYFSERTRCSL